MVKIFLNLVLRNFLKDKVLNTLNLLGLSMGLIAAALIVLYADHELSYDKFHPDGENIHRMEGKTNSALWFSSLGMEHGKELISGKYPEVKSIVTLNNQNSMTLSYGDKTFTESRAKQVAPGSGFFDFFGFTVLEGDQKTFLNEPHVVIVTESTANKYFGNTSPIGEAIKYNSLLLKVTGVIADLPTNSHLKFDLLYTNPNIFGQEHFHTETYVKLVNGVSSESIEEKILAMEGVAFNDGHELSDVNLVPVADIYFKSQASFGSGGTGDPLQLYIFIVIGALILLIAVTNYVNLSMAIYSSKGMEVGMRKVLGESRPGIISAFFFESLFMVLLTIPLVLLGLKFLIPKFNTFMGLNLENMFISSPNYWIVALVFFIALSILTMIYPALTLTGTKVSTLLKSKTSIHSTGGIRLRNLLIFVQFMLLFTLGISAWFMNRQISYLDNKDMGFKAENVIKITNGFDLGQMNEYYLLKNELLSSPQISGMTFGPMIGDGSNALAYKPEGQDEIYENLLSYGVDMDYFDVMGIDIISGEFKTTLNASDSGQVVSLVNQHFIDEFGWNDDPIGKRIILRPGSENELNRTVSAVFDDFHYFSLKEKISPQIISLKIDPDFINTNILIKAATSDIPSAVEAIKTAWAKIQPDISMQYDFMDDAVRRLYIKEKQTGQISVTFSMLAVLLSLLGLTGFMVYIISLKSKEIAVRKVLGASLIQIIALLNKQLFSLILIAAAIGSALSYWLVNTWLQDYAYAITLEPITFVLAALIVYVIVFAITSLQSLKSAQLNPTLALKNE